MGGDISITWPEDDSRPVTADIHWLAGAEALLRMQADGSRITITARVQRVDCGMNHPRAGD